MLAQYSCFCHADFKSESKTKFKGNEGGCVFFDFHSNRSYINIPCMKNDDLSLSCFFLFSCVFFALLFFLLGYRVYSSKPYDPKNVQPAEGWAGPGRPGLSILYIMIKLQTIRLLPRGGSEGNLRIFFIDHDNDNDDDDDDDNDNDDNDNDNDNDNDKEEKKKVSR
jgi:hypothetical protein